MILPRPQNQNRGADNEAKEETSTIRYCKKCRCKLPQTWKYEQCENCRRERAVKVRKIVGGVGGVAAVAVLPAKKYGPKVVKAVAKGIKIVVKVIPK